MAVRGSLRVIRALVATVVPWENMVTFLKSTFARSTPDRIPSIGSAVEDVFSIRILPEPSSRMQMSVKVPPTSTATLNFSILFFTLKKLLRARTRVRVQIRSIGAEEQVFLSSGVHRGRRGGPSRDCIRVSLGVRPKRLR